MLENEVINQLRKLNVEVLDTPQMRTGGIPYEKLPPAVGQFLYCLTWPKGVTYRIPEPDFPEESEMWMIDFTCQLMPFEDDDGTYQMCGIADGGSYILAFEVSDESADPKILVLDHDEDELPPDTYRLSDLLTRIEVETE